MEEINIKNFVKRTPHIKTLEDVHLLAVYIYASVAGVYKSEDKDKILFPFSDSKEERRTRARLVDEAFSLCKSMGLVYVDEMGRGLEEFFNMTDEQKAEVSQKIF